MKEDSGVVVVEIPRVKINVRQVLVNPQEIPVYQKIVRRVKEDSGVTVLVGVSIKTIQKRSVRSIKGSRMSFKKVGEGSRVKGKVKTLKSIKNVVLRSKSILVEINER